MDAVTVWADAALTLPPAVLAAARSRVSTHFRRLEARHGAKGARRVLAAGLRSLSPPSGVDDLAAVAPVIAAALILKEPCKRSAEKPNNHEEESEGDQAATKVAGSGDAPPVLDAKDVRQRDHYSCGAAASMAAASVFGAGPDSLDEWKDALGTTVERSTSPQAILGYLPTLGLRVEAREGMTVGDLADAVRAGSPVICPVQDYGRDVPDEAEWSYGHWLCVIGVIPPYVMVQDSSEDNVLAGSSSIAAPGRVLIDEETWVENWHDVGEDGTRYVRYGIVVSGRLTDDRPDGTKAVVKADAPDADMGTPEERAELLADLLYGLFGADALDMLEDKRPESKGWDPKRHPRGPDGRFIKVGSSAAGQAAKAAVDAALKQPTSAHLTSVMDHANILTLKQLQELRKAHGIRAPGRLRAQLVDAIRAKLEAGGASDAKPAPPAVPYKDETDWETGKPQSGTLNGVDFAPAPHHFWEKVKDVDVGEPPPVPGKKIDRVGIIIKEKDGRIWIVQPTNGFGNRKYTLPGGGVEKGLTDQQNALKEVWEETGLQCKITGHLGDFEDSNNGNNGRLYIGERIGGAPWDAKIESFIKDKNGNPAAESERVTLVTPEKAAERLHRTDDLAQLAAVHPIDVKTSVRRNVMKKIVDAMQPAAEAYKLKKPGGRGKDYHGNAELHVVQEWRGFNGKPKVVDKKDMDALAKAGTHVELLRGVAGVAGRTGEELAEQFRAGDHFPGHGVFGSGTYADSNKGYGNVANQYAGGGAVLRMALPKTAKVVSVSDLEKGTLHGGRWGGLDHPPGFHAYPRGKSAGECWLGVQAALAGYDAIYVDGKQKSNGGYGEGYYVILNRSILTVQKEDAKGHTIQ